ncbi:glycine-rich protein DC91-like [Vespula maculifrons]|uniref:Glycine-rich protein DC91-like n=1 Tax=Vespula maculifrons TaxID=7453 RepID=A0ABD2ARU0_VESMC
MHVKASKSLLAFPVHRREINYTRGIVSIRISTISASICKEYIIVEYNVYCKTIVPPKWDSRHAEPRLNYIVDSERLHGILRRAMVEDVSVSVRNLFYQQPSVHLPKDTRSIMNRIVIILIYEISRISLVLSVLLSLLSLAAAAPVIVDQRYNHEDLMRIVRHLQNIKRSDHESFGSSGDGGSYGGGDYSGGHGGGGFEASAGQFESGGGHLDGGHQDYSSFGGYGGHGGDEGSHGISLDGGHNFVHSVPVSEHVEVTKPVAVPVVKEIGIPVPQPIKIGVPHPVAIGVPQPYPVAVPVSKPVPIQIVKTVAVPVEKKVPYPVEKHIPVPVEKPVPITIEKHVPVPVVKPYPIRIPVYKTIYHHAKKEEVNVMYTRTPHAKKHNCGFHWKFQYICHGFHGKRMPTELIQPLEIRSTNSNEDLTQIWRVFILFAIVGCSHGSGLSLDGLSLGDHNAGLDLGSHTGGSLTLGEISLHHEDELPGIDLGGHSGDWDSGISLGSHGGYGGYGGHGGVPVVKDIPIKIPKLTVQTEPQPYPVNVFVSKPVPYEVVKPVITKVEKKVPTPVEKIIPYKIEKPVPFKVYKHIPVPVPKPIPIKIPIYKTIIHKSGHH